MQHTLTADEWTAVVKKPEYASVSWWVGIPDANFHERALREWPRMAHMAGDPVVKSIRPMLLGGKLP